MHLVDVAMGVIKVHETGRWAHINVKLLHFLFVLVQFILSSLSSKLRIHAPAPLPNFVLFCQNAHYSQIAEVNGSQILLKYSICTTDRSIPFPVRDIDDIKDLVRAAGRRAGIAKRKYTNPANWQSNFCMQKYWPLLLYHESSGTDFKPKRPSCRGAL